MSLRYGGDETSVSIEVVSETPEPRPETILPPWRTRSVPIVASELPDAGDSRIVDRHGRATGA